MPPSASPTRSTASCRMPKLEMPIRRIPGDRRSISGIPTASSCKSRRKTDVDHYNFERRRNRWRSLLPSTERSMPSTPTRRRVKTEKGWRFKSRQVVRSKSGGGTDPELMASLKRPVRVKSEPADNVTAPNGSLSVWDYMQIEQLVASYGHALDSGFGKGDNGDAYAGLYTRDGVAFLSSKGYDTLAALAREQPRGPNYVRHYITHHLIDPSPDGATGKAYLAVLDIGEQGKPNTVFLGGHYEDTYVRTPDGWRIKTRNLLPPKHGPQPAQATAR